MERGRAIALKAGRLLVVCLLAACGGHGGGGPTAPPPPSAGVSFTPAGSAGADSLALSIVLPNDGTRFTLVLAATQVQDLYGIAFDLHYPTDLLHFEGAEEGTFLSASGSVATSFQATERTAGDVVVGLSRLGAVAGVGGGGPLVRLTFTTLRAGGGELSFSDNQAFDRNGQEKGDVSWVAGSVEVVR